MIKNFISSIMGLTIYFILAMVFSVLILDFSDMYSFFIYASKMIGIVCLCYCLGFGGSWFVTTTIDKIKDRHRKRFMWYYKLGLYESARLIEPKFAKKYWIWN